MSHYIQLAGLYEQLSSKLSDLATAYYELDSLKQDVINCENQNKVLTQRCNTLEEQITTKNNILHSKESIINILQDQINNNTTFDSIDLIYNDININVLKEHINYLMLLEEDSMPSAFEEIIESLNKLVELKKEYDKGQENTGNERNERNERNEKDERPREF